MGRRKKNIGSAGKETLDRSSVSVGHAKEAKRKRAQPAKFSNYVFKVLKQVHPQLSMTNRAMKVMDDFMHDIYSRLVAEAAGLVKMARKSTLSASEFQTATRLILPGELAKHAVSDATKAVASFLSSRAEDARRPKHHKGMPKEAVSSTSAGKSTTQEPVEIEIFGTAPRITQSPHKPLIISSSEPEESMENELEKESESPHVDEVNEPSREVLRDTEMENNDRSIENLDHNENIESSSVKDTTDLDSTMQLEQMDTSEQGEHSKGFEENVPEEGSLKQLKEIGSLTPPSEPELDAQSGTSSVSSRITHDDLPQNQELHNDERVEKTDESSKEKDTLSDAETVDMETEASKSENVEPSPVVTVHVEVTHRGNPTVISDVNVFENSGTKNDTNSSQISSTSNSLPIDAENDVSENGDSQLPLSSTENEASSESIVGKEVNESCKATVTVRCSKVTTTRATFIHERKEQISEWFSESDSFN